MIKALPISIQLLLSYLLVAALPLAGLATFYLTSFERLLRDTVLENMATLADKKVEHITSHISDRLIDVEQIGKRKVILEGVVSLGQLFRTGGLDAPDYQSAASLLRNDLKSSNAISDYDDLLLMDTAGNVVFSFAQNRDLGTHLRQGPYRDTQLAKGVEVAMQTRQARLTRFAPYAPAGNQPVGFLTTPVIENGMVKGVLALQLNARTLETVTINQTGLGRTGETVLAQKDGSAVLYTAPLKHIQDAAYRYRMTLHEASLPMQAALVGAAGRGIIRDYVGIESVAAWRYLPTLGWGMVVKIDAREALAPATRLRHISYLALALFLTLSGAVAYFFGRRLSRPIRRLTEVADRIALGDFSRHAPLHDHDELGRLSHAFSHMTDALNESRHDLEVKVEARSQELREITALQNEIVDKAGALVVVLDRKGRIRRFNRACEELTQYGFAEVEGKFVWELFLMPEDRVAIQEDVFNAAVRDPHALRESHTHHWVARDG